MDKLAFQKAIDTLKNTDCNSKEKIQRFDQIFASLTSLSHHTNYKSFVQSAVQVLILFCEDNDPNVRISAEENLNRVVRSCEKQQQLILIQIELYHELKKNGNERSLRICLNLFAHFSHAIKQRRRKVYAQNLVPCLLAIAKRPEPLVIDAFGDFMRAFSLHLLNCLSEHETTKLLAPLLDNLGLECAVRRRCAAQVIATMLEHSQRSASLTRSIVTRMQENLARSHEANGVLGSLGLLRVLAPRLVASSDLHSHVLQMLETSLNVLRQEASHTLINASLEFINALLSASVGNRAMTRLLCDGDRMLHKDVLLARHSALISSSSRKSSAETIKNSEQHLQVPVTLGDFSDVEGDSFKSTDFDVAPVSSSPNTLRNVIGAAETMSIKSTDSINSFFSSILSTSNTDTVTKFFRKSSTSDSPAHASKCDDKSLDLSLDIACQDSQALPETAEIAQEDETLEIVDIVSQSPQQQPTQSQTSTSRELYIGSIYDQSVVEFVARLVASKFLLEGSPGALISDQLVRVSIKSLALSTIAWCVELRPELLLTRLPKDFTDESMMVESLLSFLVDEDIRLEAAEEEKKKQPSVSGGDLLEVKENHFGECTTATFLDYFAPLSEDPQGLLTLKGRLFEEKSRDRDESAKRINRDLCQLLSRAPTMETTLTLPADGECQLLADVLLFASHGDPVLRGSVYAIAGAFVGGVLRRNLDYAALVSRSEFVREALGLDKMIELLLKGVRDEIHSVVKQTLTVWGSCFNRLVAVLDASETESILGQLLTVVGGKTYWLVQCTFCDFITGIDMCVLARAIGNTRCYVYEKQIRQHIFALIRENDFRVRNHASESFAKWIGNLAQSDIIKGEETSLSRFIERNFFKFEPLVNVKKVTTNKSVERELSKVLYEISNLLVDLKDKNQQFGVIYALKVLLRKFTFASYAHVWREFNFLSILVSFVNKNAVVALDISCQCDMLEVIGGLGENDSGELLAHLLKILNIYAHLVTGAKPLIVPKGKSDLFTSAKELAIINSIGFFTGDSFYLKLYVVLKSAFDSFRMTINAEAETKLKHLLYLALQNLRLLLEHRTMGGDDAKLIEEIVGYLNQLVLFQPDDCIPTAKVLLRFLFQRNFCCRRSSLDTVTASSDPKFVFDTFETFFAFDASKISQNSDALIKLFDTLVIQGLRLFSKSSALLQTKVLDMLCQLLELNINYMQLDAKKVFVDFVLKQIEFIENGLVTDGALLTSKIIEFLLHLTKLRDKKILTMPKVINIVDNLLASTNADARECGVQALVTMALELFFTSSKIASTEPEVVEAHSKDVNAQREVALSMMLKFVNHADIQECLEWILLKARHGGGLEVEIDENEIYQALIQGFSDESSSATQLFRSVSKNVRLESKNFKSILGIYWKTLEAKEDFGRLALLVEIQQSVLSIAEEIYLVNHIKLHHQKQHLEGEAVKKFLKLHLRYLTAIIARRESDKKNVKNFMDFLKFLKFPSLFLDVKEMIDLREVIEASCDELLEATIDFVISLDFELLEIEKVIGESSARSRTKSVTPERKFEEIPEKSPERQFEEASTKSSESLAKSFEDLPATSSTQKSSHKMIKASLDTRKLSTLLYRSIFAKRANVKDWSGDEITTFFKDAKKLEILLNFSHETLLKSLMEDEKISKIIIRKLSLVKVSEQRIKFILENIHESCLKECCVYLITSAANGNAPVTFLQFVMIKKLQVGNPKVPSTDLEDVKSKILEFKVDKKLKALLKTIDDKIERIREKDQIIFDFSAMTKTVDESWLLEQATEAVTCANSSPQHVAEMLFEIKSEAKIAKLFANPDFNIKLLTAIFRVFFRGMLRSFRVDCIQKNPHLTYMKVPPVLKTATTFLSSLLSDVNDERLTEVSEIVITFLENVSELNATALVFVEAKFVEKFIVENFLKPQLEERLVCFANVAVSRGKNLEIIFSLLQALFRVETIDMNGIGDEIVTLIYQLLFTTFEHWEAVTKYQHPQLFDDLTGDRIEVIKQAIFIAHIQETIEYSNLTASQKHLVESSLAVSRDVLRLAPFYQFVITPYEILLGYRSGDDLLDSSALRLKQIPIEYLSDAELLERYVRRINRYGFAQRQHFEEIFMTLLVLLNQSHDMHVAEEEFCIRQLCLQTNVDMILACFGRGHLPRGEKLPHIEKVGVKKLHHVQDLLDPRLSVFYQPNLERCTLTSRKHFGMNQFSLDYTWHLTNGDTATHIMRNMTHVHAERMGIDYRSALQLVYDLMTQLVDEHAVLVLPQLTRLVEVLDSSEQFKWLQRKMLAMHETVCGEDTLAHQHIVYLLCRSTAVLVPTLSDVQQLVPVLNKYLGCNHLFVRNATLHGMLCVFEALVKTNTTIGAISDEMRLLRTAIVNYTNKHGIVYECAVTATSPAHDKLVWSLNFYVLENTLKFGECAELLIDTLISANNVLKRSNDVDLYFLIVNGLERLVIVDADNRLLREKAEKLALDLLRSDNRQLSAGGLKLLVTCMYVGSLQQLETTEQSNGIVQDEPEIVMQSTEKIEVLFGRIRGAPPDEAETCGRVLGRVLRDLLPPNEVLTRIVKELLAPGQMNAATVSRIAHQVFRTAIDSSFLALLQEWLVCALPSFLAHPAPRKSLLFLVLIFVSSTLNASLLAVLPLALDERMGEQRLRALFAISACDFYTRLSSERQKGAFCEAFMVASHESNDNGKLFASFFKALK